MLFSFSFLCLSSVVDWHLEWCFFLWAHWILDGDLFLVVFSLILLLVALLVFLVLTRVREEGPVVPWWSFWVQHWYVIGSTDCCLPNVSVISGQSISVWFVLFFAFSLFIYVLAACCFVFVVAWIFSTSIMVSVVCCVALGLRRKFPNDFGFSLLFTGERSCKVFQHRLILCLFYH